VSKADLYPEELRAEIMQQLRGNKIAEHPLIWSSQTHENLELLKEELFTLVS
jgi:hypothetical protein